MTNRSHDKRILNWEFKEGYLVLFFNSRLRVFLKKLWSQWFGPFLVKRVTPSTMVEVWSEPTCPFTVNGQRLKHYTIRDAMDQGMSLVLKLPSWLLALMNRRAKTMLNKTLRGRKPMLLITYASLCYFFLHAPFCFQLLFRYPPLEWGFYEFIPSFLR